MRADSTTKFLKAFSLAAAVTGLLPASVAGQTPGDNTGFRAQNAYISYQPWESVNPYGGNVLWHFTDFVLPGNAGMNVAWTRTFNSTLDGEWRFGVAGIPIRIEEPGNGGLPTVFTADGGASGTDLLDENDENVVFCHGLLALYDRSAHQMKLPNGWVVTFDIPNAQQNAWFPRLVTDPFNNSITFGYAAAQLDYAQLGYAFSPLRLTTVQQSGPHGVSRTVTITYDAYDRVHTVVANGRTWTYAYLDNANASWFRARLASVQSPDGTSWQYANPQADTRVVTTPLGAEVTYTFADHAMDDASTRRVLTQRTTGGRAVITDRIPGGVWNYFYSNHAGDDAFAATNIVTPGATRIVGYGFLAPDGSSTRGKPTAIYVYDGNSVPVQIEHFVYGDVPQQDGPPEVGVLTDHSISRDGRTCHEHYDYSPGDHADFHNPSLTHQWGCGAERWIERWFKNEFGGTYRKVVLTDEWVEIPGERLVTRHYGFDLDTGFMTSQIVGGVPTIFTPSAGGNVGTAADAAGREVSYEYSKGAVSAIHYPSGFSDLDVTSVINGDGTVQSQTRHYGTGTVTTTFTYDSAGQLTTITPPLGNGTTITYEGWSPQGDSRIVTTSGGYSSTTRVNGLGQAYSTIDSFGVQAWTKFDAEGRVVEQSFPFITSPTGTERAFYDALGRVIERRHTDDTAAHLAYGNDGNGNGTVAITDEESHTTTQVWAGFGSPDDGQLVRVTDAANHTWTYQYGATGKLTLVTAPDNTHRSWIYTGHTESNLFDGFLLREETQPESGPTNYAYNTDGSLASRTDANGTITASFYDGVGRLYQANVGGRVTTLTYEPGSSNIAQVQAPDATTDYAYDAIGNLVSRVDTVDGFTFTSTFAYDYTNANGLKDVTYPSGRRIRYTLDAIGRPTSVSDLDTSTAYASQLTYAPTGALTSYTTGNGLVHTLAYDPQRLWLTDIKVTQSGTDLLHFAYDQHDNTGNITRITDPRAGMTQMFGYDALNRLHTASGSYGSIQYDYNAHGDRVTNGYGSYTYNASTLRLTGQNSDTFSYDNVGNLRYYNNDEFQYFPEGPMKRSVVAGSITDYGYAGDGWRVKKVSGSNATYYFRGAGGSVLTEWLNPTASPTVPRDFIYAGGKLIAAVRRTLAVADGTPGDFGFTNITNAAITTLTYSNIVPITGIVGSVATSIAGGGAEYQICSDAACANGSGFTSAGSSIANNQYLRVRLTSSGAFSTGTGTTMTVGGVSAGWSVTTGPQDSTPDGFGFTTLTGVWPSTNTLSSLAQITGINGSVSISISGNGAAYRICNDPSCANATLTSSPGTISNGQYVQLGQTSSPTRGAGVQTTLTVGTGAATWAVTTVAPGVMLEGHAIGPNAGVYSPSGTYLLWYGGDGNLVLYRTGDWAVMWAAWTQGTNPGLFALSGGNLAVFTAEWQVPWCACGLGAASVTVQDDGNLVLRDANGATVWQALNWPNLAGNWFNLNAQCCEIVVDGYGHVAGYWRGGGLWPAYQIGNYVYDTTSGLVGEVAEAEQTIFWSNGDAWRRTPYDPDLQGPWYSPQYDVWCWVDINGYGDAGDVWDEWGNRIFVRQSGPWIEILWSSDWGVYDGGAIYWSDGRVWVR